LGNRLLDPGEASASGGAGTGLASRDGMGHESALQKRAEMSPGPLCAEAQADGVPCTELGRDCETCERAVRGSAGTTAALADAAREPEPRS